ncbi:MAG: Gfo/Idh/MocA family oxidoreductase [Nanoarchaeota archaeon]|nr:Gfo/Idh/MocA family oxidoreductase [Nanoarchaeota archaeon]
MTKVQFGVLGTSRVAEKSVMPAILSSEKSELGMIGSRNPEKAAEVAKKFGCDSFGTYEDVLRNKEIDAVYISLPPAFQEEWAIKAAEAGKHAYIEKPAATLYASAKRMVETARKNNVRLIEGLMFRYHPQNARAKELIREGVLGELLQFEGCFGFAMPEKETNMMRQEAGGGCLNYCGVYPIAASRMVFQEEPISVYCKLNIDAESGVDTETRILLEFSGGKTAFASSYFGSYYQSTYAVLGTKAHIRMKRAYAVPSNMETKMFLDKDDKVEEIVFPPADHFRLMIDEFCEEIAKGAASEKDYEGDVLGQARALQAVKLSGKEGRVVNLLEVE